MKIIDFIKSIYSLSVGDRGIKMTGMEDAHPVIS